MVRRGYLHGHDSKCPHLSTTILAVATGLLSLRTTDSFLSSPLSARSASGGLGRSEAGTAVASSSTRGGSAGVLPRETRTYRSGRHAVRLSGVAEEQQQVAESVIQSTEKLVANNNMKPFVVVPRRDSKTWFDSIMAGAGSGPDALAGLSKAGEAHLGTLTLPDRNQEPYRYTDLQSLYRTDFAPAPEMVVGEGNAGSKAALAAAAAAIEPYLLEESKGQQMVFVNGVFSDALSDVSAIGGVEGLVAGHVGAMEGEQLDKAKDMLAFLPETDADFRTTQGSLPFACLNQACFADAGVIFVAEGVKVEKAIQVIFFSDGLSETPTVSHPRLVINAGADSHVTFTQSYLSQGGVCLANGYTRILVGDRATVEHDYVEEMGEADRMVDTVSVEQTTNSTYTINQVIAGGFDARANVQIDLLASGSHCNIYSAALTTKNQRQDVHTTIRHLAEGTTCTQEQRNVVADKADCVFKGRIVINGIAQKTDANQLCRTLLVSDAARVTVMPSMEIIANDVKCTHGATICDLEDEELFYLMSRGINKIQAKTLVIKSFADVVVKRLRDPSLRERLTTKLVDAAPRQDRAVTGVYSSI